MLKEVLNLRFSNINKKKFQSDEKKTKTLKSGSSGRSGDIYRSKVDSDTDDEDHVELVLLRRTNTGAWGRAAGGVISTGSTHKRGLSSFGGSRSSIGSNIGGIGSASRSSLSGHRGSISETVAALTAQRSSLSSGSLLSTRASTSSRPVPNRVNSSGTSGRPSSTAGSASSSSRPQNRRGSGLSLTSLGFSGNSGVSHSLDAADEYRSGFPSVPEKEGGSGSFGVEKRLECANRASIISTSGVDSSKGRVSITGCDEEKYEEESCDGVVTRLLDRGNVIRQDERTGVRSIGINMMKCASWVNTKVNKVRIYQTLYIIFKMAGSEVSSI